MAYITNGTITVHFSVTDKESVGRSSSITKSPVEGGQSINDYVLPDSPANSISGLIVGPDAAYKLSLLNQMWENGDICYYEGRNSFANFVIEKFDSDHPADIRNGLRFSMDFGHVTITNTEEFIINENISVSLRQISAQIKEENNKGKQTTTKK